VRDAQQDELTCKNTATNPIVADDALVFRTGSTCRPDFDADGDIDSADLNILLTVIGQSDSANRGQLGDVDDDNDCDSTDLNILLLAFGSCSTGLSLGEGGGDHPAPPCIALFGFQTVESFMEWFEKQSAEEQSNFISVLLEVLPQFIEEENQ